MTAMLVEPIRMPNKNLSVDPWVASLSDEGFRQNEALVELGELLKKRLERSFRGQAKVDSSFIDDVVQDSLTTILNSLSQFQGKSQFATWATTLAVRTAIREMRRMRWKDTSLDQMLQGESERVLGVSKEERPESQSDSREMVATMYHVIENDLTKMQREVLMAHLNGMPQAEIGRHLGKNRNAIYKLGFDARKKLKEGMVKAGFSAEDLESFEVER